MCGGSDKETRVIGGVEKSPDPSTYTYTAMSPAEMYAQYRETGQVPYSYYGAGAPSSLAEYNAHRAYYGDSYVDKPTQKLSDAVAKRVIKAGPFTFTIPFDQSKKSSGNKLFRQQ